MSTDAAIALELISDFNVDLFGRYLANLPAGPACAVHAAPFGQVYQTLTAPASESARSGGAVLWTRPESVIQGFARAAALETVDHEAVLAEIDSFAALVAAYARQCRLLMVASWTLPPNQRFYGPLDWRPGLGLAHLLARANLRLAEVLAPLPNVHLLDSERWLRAAGGRAHPPKMWFATKVPYAPAVFEDAALDVKALLRGSAGQARKLVVVDLDDTLWGGIVGETGWQGLRLGGHDHVGEAFAAFQAALKGLTRRGVQLAIASKNDEATALAAIDQNPEMRLRRADFAGWRINWQDKAANIAALVKELNLGLSAVVFLDDNPAERGRVREALPEVLVPEWPSDPSAYVQALEALRCFDLPALSAEDRGRAAMYADERARRDAMADLGSPEDWLRSLGVTVTAAPLTTSDKARAAQLFNKTNQFNLATRRLTEAELADWVTASGRQLWTVTVSDRFGDMGLTGLVSLEMNGPVTRIVDFILSCRVMGRKVEDSMLHVAVAQAIRQGAHQVVMTFRATDRNGPTLEFLERCGFVRDGDDFSWDCIQPYPLPDTVSLTLPESTES